MREQLREEREGEGVEREREEEGGDVAKTRERRRWGDRNVKLSLSGLVGSRLTLVTCFGEEEKIKEDGVSRGKKERKKKERSLFRRRTSDDVGLQEEDQSQFHEGEEREEERKRTHSVIVGHLGVSED